jgi:D-serine deaminase-like pyridoxal phosphate-dependent protein
MKLEITKPTLLLNPEIARRNIQRMAEKAQRHHVRLRPHFKTHQSAAVGEWFREVGIDAITVSSIDMAAYFAEHGWRDITIAFPVNWRQINTINELATPIKLNLLVESVETVAFLQQNLAAPVDVWLKIDAGSHRTGILWDEVASLTQIGTAIQAADKLRLAGVLTHNSSSYRAGSIAAIQIIYDDTVQRLKAARESLGQPNMLLSIGDTPACSVVEDVSAVDEIRPGNFVFYDVMQTRIGSCEVGDIAVAVACPVVAKHPARNTVIVHGGAVHLSSDFLPQDKGRLYGLVALPSESGWTAPLPECYVQSISQEHGVLHVDDATMNRLHIGDVLMILPIHSCLTVDLYRNYNTPSGDKLAIAEFR